MFITITHAFNPTPEGYKQYTIQYNKNYTPNEYRYRYHFFKTNMNYINSEKRSYTMGINQFTDMSKMEFRIKYLGHNFNTPKTLSNPTSYRKNIPASLDWRANGYVTNVKDQQQCGSCWAFSAVGAIEGQHAKKTNNLVSLSEQNLVDCSYSNGCDGCNGGWPEAAMRYVINNTGIDTEDAYPYTESDGDCHYNKSTRGATISKTVNITQGNMTDLYLALGNIGPISVAIDAEDDLQFYKSGIYKSEICNSHFLNHAVLAVGYGEVPSTQNYLYGNTIISKVTSKYIIIKNSWGTDWGMDGYVYFSTDIDNMCGIAQAASYPLV